MVLCCKCVDKMELASAEVSHWFVYYKLTRLDCVTHCGNLLCQCLQAHTDHHHVVNALNYFRSWSPQYKRSTSWRKRTCSSKSVEGIYLTWICLTVPKKYHALFEFSGLDIPSNDRESLPGNSKHCRLFHVQCWLAIDVLHVGPRWCSTWSVTTVWSGPCRIFMFRQSLTIDRYVNSCHVLTVHADMMQ